MTGLVEYDFNWHDGVLVDLQLDGFGAKQSGIRLIVDLYPDTDSNSQRRRYLCTGNGLTRLFVKGDIAELVRNATSGNIDWMRLEFTETTETVILLLFGGYLEAEAATFTLTELQS